MSHFPATKKQHWTLKQFNWRAMLVRILVNGLTLIITVLLTPSMGFVNPTIWAILLLAIVLGVLNAIVKPIIQFFTLSLIFVTYGLVIIFINTFMLYLLSWLLPNYFHVDNFFWALLGGAIMGIAAGFLESLFGLTLPIVDEESINEPMRRAMEIDAKKKQTFPYRQLEKHTGVTPPATPTLPGESTETIPVPTVEAGEQSVPVSAVSEPDQKPVSVAASVKPEQTPAPETTSPETESEPVSTSSSAAEESEENIETIATEKETSTTGESAEEQSRSSDEDERVDEIQRSKPSGDASVGPDQTQEMTEPAGDDENALSQESVQPNAADDLEQGGEA